MKVFVSLDGREELFPMKVVAGFLVPDWRANHDPGGEDDGLEKAVTQYLHEKFDKGRLER